MSKFKRIILDSLNELRKTQALAIAALLLAASVVLAQYRISVGNFLRIGFSDRTIEFTSYLLGPVTGAIFGALSDVVNYILKPEGAYFFGFTFNNILKGLIYGFALYKTPVKLKNIIIAEVCVAVICNIFLGTFWLTILNGKAFGAILPFRVLKNLCMIPIDVFIFYALAKALDRFKLRSNLNI